MQPQGDCFPAGLAPLPPRPRDPGAACGQHGGKLRQSYHRLGKRTLRLANRYAHARQMRRARQEIKRLKTFLGRVARDVGRKITTCPGVARHFAQPLARVSRLLAQQKSDHGKLYALHAPEVECLAKGKAHKRYECRGDVPVKDLKFRCTRCSSALTDFVVMSRDAMDVQPWRGDDADAGAGGHRRWQRPWRQINSVATVALPRFPSTARHAELLPELGGLAHPTSAAVSLNE